MPSEGGDAAAAAACRTGGMTRGFAGTGGGGIRVEPLAMITVRKQQTNAAARIKVIYEHYVTWLPFADAPLTHQFITEISEITKIII